MTDCKSAAITGDNKRPPGRPESVPGGKRRNVYIDDESWRIAQELGGGKASEGIRAALKAALT